MIEVIIRVHLKNQFLQENFILSCQINCMPRKILIWTEVYSQHADRHFLIASIRLLLTKQNHSRKFQKFKRSSMPTRQSRPLDWKLCEFSFLWTNTIWQLATLFCRRHFIFQCDTIYHFHYHREGSTDRNWSVLF